MFLKSIYTTLFIFIFSACYGQFYPSNQIQNIKDNRQGSEGNLYIDTIANKVFVGLANGDLHYLPDSTDGQPTLYEQNDSLFYVTGMDTTIIELGTSNESGYWLRLDDTPAASIPDSIKSVSSLTLVPYPNSRDDSDTDALNYLFTDNQGNLKSARREIIPPAVSLDIATNSTGNTFNYYNHYFTQLSNVGLSPIPQSTLDFYVLYYDTAVFANVSISNTGVLSYDVISNKPDNNRVIHVVFYTK